MSTPVALITGGAKRIGACLARRFHSEGYCVVIHCRHSKDLADELALELNRIRPDSAKVVSSDLTVVTEVKTLAEQALACWGRLDVLINNASEFRPSPIGDINESQVKETLNANLGSPLLLAQWLAPALKEQQGCIINMSDVHGQNPFKSHTLYCVSKAGINMVTKSLALELAPEVRVNAIAPGAILWPEQNAAKGHSAEDKQRRQKEQRVLAQVPLARMGSPDDIADLALFLARDGRYITGQVIAVDGGRSLAPLEGA